MTVTPHEPSSVFPAQEALMQFTQCIGQALDDICSYGLTIGETYVPFAPDPEDDCEDEEEWCSQVWVRVTDTQVDTSNGWSGSCAVDMTYGLEVGVLRCFPAEENGEAPQAADVTAGALQMIEDQQKIFCAAVECNAWGRILPGSWSPVGPMGMQFGGIWTFRVELI